MTGINDSLVVYHTLKCGWFDDIVHFGFFWFIVEVLFLLYDYGT